MSNFIDKLSSKISGSDSDKEHHQHKQQQGSDRSYGQQQQERSSGQQRSGQQNLNTAGGRDQQYSTEAGLHDDAYGSQQYGSNRGSNQQTAFGANQEPTPGTATWNKDSDIGGKFQSRDDRDDREGWDDDESATRNLGSGRQTRSSQNQGGQFSQDEGYDQEGSQGSAAYMNRNL